MGSTLDLKQLAAEMAAAYSTHAIVPSPSALDAAFDMPQRVTPENIPALAEQLAQFKLGLYRNGELVEEGSGRNSLRSPALCLGEIARVAKLTPGDLVSSGTLTTPTPIAPGQQWKATVNGLDLPGLVLQVNS